MSFFAVDPKTGKLTVADLDSYLKSNPDVITDTPAEESTQQEDPQIKALEQLDSLFPDALQDQNTQDPQLAALEKLDSLFPEDFKTENRSWIEAFKYGLATPLQSHGTTTSYYAPEVGEFLKKAESWVDPDYVSGAQEFMGGDGFLGFNWRAAPRAILEQSGQILGSIGSRVVGGMAGGAAGSAVGSVVPGVGSAAGGVAGTTIGAFAGPFLFYAHQVAGPIAEERAKNNNRETPNQEDWNYALTTAAAAGTLDAVGAQFLPGGKKAIGGLIQKAVRSGGGEGAVEFGQTTLEQVGETVATEKGLDVDLKESLGAAILGTGAGVGASAVDTTVDFARRRTFGDPEKIADYQDEASKRAEETLKKAQRKAESRRQVDPAADVEAEATAAQQAADDLENDPTTEATRRAYEEKAANLRTQAENLRKNTPKQQTAAEKLRERRRKLEELETQGEATQPELPLVTPEESTILQKISKNEPITSEELSTVNAKGLAYEADGELIISDTGLKILGDSAPKLSEEARLEEVTTSATLQDSILDSMPDQRVFDILQAGIEMEVNETDPVAKQSLIDDIIEPARKSLISRMEKPVRIGDPDAEPVIINRFRIAAAQPDPEVALEQTTKAIESMVNSTVDTPLELVYNDPETDVTTTVSEVDTERGILRGKIPGSDEMIEIPVRSITEGLASVSVLDPTVTRSQQEETQNESNAESSEASQGIIGDPEGRQEQAALPSDPRVREEGRVQPQREVIPPQQQAPTQQETQGAPAFISKAMEQDLADLGYTRSEVRKITPAQAQEIVRNQRTFKPTEATAGETQPTANQTESSQPRVLKPETAERLLSLPAERRDFPFGDQNVSLRQDILEELTGTRPPKSKAGAQAVRKALRSVYGDNIEAGLKSTTNTQPRTAPSPKAPKKAKVSLPKTATTQEAKARLAPLKSLRKGVKDFFETQKLNSENTKTKSLAKGLFNSDPTIFDDINIEIAQYGDTPWAGKYNPTTKTATINLDKTDNLKGGSATTLMHEMVHHALRKKVSQWNSDPDSLTQIEKDSLGVLQQTLDIMQTIPADSKIWDGISTRDRSNMTKDIEEFVTEVLTNPQAQRVIEKLSPEVTKLQTKRKETKFQAFLRNIAELLFGAPLGPTSAYNSAFQSAFNLIRAKPNRRFSSSYIDSNYTPIIAAVTEQGGIRSPKRGRQNRKAEYDGIISPMEQGSGPFIKYIMNRDGGLAVDEMAQMLYEQNLLADPSPDTLWDSMRQEIASYYRVKEQEKLRQEYFDNQEKAQNNLSPEEPIEGRIPQQVDILQNGSQFTAGGSQYEVTNINPSTNETTIRDNQTGAELVFPPSSVIQIDEGSLQEPIEDDSNPFSPTAEDGLFSPADVQALLDLAAEKQTPTEILQQIPNGTAKGGYPREIAKVMRRLLGDEYVLNMDSLNPSKNRKHASNTKRAAERLAPVAEAALRAFPNFEGWYSGRVEMMQDILSDLDPSFLSPENYQDFLTILAISSDGNSVDSQFQDSWKAYQALQRGEPITSDLFRSTNDKKIATKINNYLAMKEQVGHQRMKELLHSFMTVRELRNTLHTEFGIPEATATKMVKGELADTIVSGANIFGPKLGSFYNNLNGNFDTVTMDRWFMRTFGRTFGTQLSPQSKESVAKKQTQFLDAMESLYKKEPNFAQGQIDQNAPPATQAHQVAKYFSIKENRDNLTTAQDNLRLAANRYDGVSDGLQLNEAPAGGTARNSIRAVINETLNILETKGVKLQPAELQALLWYYEKLIHNNLGSRQKDAAPDFGTAANKLFNEITGADHPSFKPSALVNPDSARRGRAGKLGRPRGDRARGNTQGQQTPRQDDTGLRAVADQVLPPTDSDEVFSVADISSGKAKALGIDGNLPALHILGSLPARFQGVSNAKQFQERINGVLEDIRAEIRDGKYFNTDIYAAPYEARQGRPLTDAEKASMLEEMHNKQRTIQEGWVDYLETGGYTPETQILILSTITKEIATPTQDGKWKTVSLGKNADRHPDPASPELAARVAESLTQPENKKKRISQIIAEASQRAEESRRASKEQVATSTEEGGSIKWVRFPSKKNDPTNFDQHVQDLTSLAKTSEKFGKCSWCTGSGAAQGQLETGDFWVGVDENGNARTAIRMEGDEIGEIRGILEGQNLEPKYAGNVRQFVESKKMEGGTEFLRDATLQGALQQFENGEITLDQLKTNIIKNDPGVLVGGERSYFDPSAPGRRGGKGAYVDAKDLTNAYYVSQLLEYKTQGYGNKRLPLGEKVMKLVEPEVDSLRDKSKIALANNTSITPGIAEKLARSEGDPESIEDIKANLLRNPNTPAQALEAIWYDYQTGQEYAMLIADHPNTPPQVLRDITNDPDAHPEAGDSDAKDNNRMWTLAAVASNPNTPLGILEDFIADSKPKHKSTLSDKVLINPSAPVDLKVKAVGNLMINVTEGAKKAADSKDTDPRILEALSKHKNPNIKLRVASNESTPPAVLTDMVSDYLSLQRGQFATVDQDTTAGRVALNPSTPIETVKALARSVTTGVRQIANDAIKFRTAQQAEPDLQSPADTQARFDELTKGLQRENLTEGSLSAWVDSNPEAYAELKELRMDSLREQGYNKKVYHGTGSRFTTFDGDKVASHLGSGVLGDGFYFTQFKDSAEGYAKNAPGSPVIMELMVKAENPLVLSSADQVAAAGKETTDILAKAVRDGYDAVDYQIFGATAEMVVPNATQVKSTNPLQIDDDGNLITPDQWAQQDNEDIRYSPAEVIENTKKTIRRTFENKPGNLYDRQLEYQWLPKWAGRKVLQLLSRGNRTFALQLALERMAGATARVGKEVEMNMNRLQGALKDSFDTKYDGLDPETKGLVDTALVSKPEILTETQQDQILTFEAQQRRAAEIDYLTSTLLEARVREYQSLRTANDRRNWKNRNLDNAQRQVLRNTMDVAGRTAKETATEAELLANVKDARRKANAALSKLPNNVQDAIMEMRNHLSMVTAKGYRDGVLPNRFNISLAGDKPIIIENTYQIEGDQKVAENILEDTDLMRELVGFTERVWIDNRANYLVDKAAADGNTLSYDDALAMAETEMETHPDYGEAFGERTVTKFIEAAVADPSWAWEDVFTKTVAQTPEQAKIFSKEGMPQELSNALQPFDDAMLTYASLAAKSALAVIRHQSLTGFLENSVNSKENPDGWILRENDPRIGKEFEGYRPVKDLNIDLPGFKKIFDGYAVPEVFIKEMENTFSPNNVGSAMAGMMRLNSWAMRANTSFNFPRGPIRNFFGNITLVMQSGNFNPRYFAIAYQSTKDNIFKKTDKEMQAYISRMTELNLTDDSPNARIVDELRRFSAKRSKLDDLMDKFAKSKWKMRGISDMLNLLYQSPDNFWKSVMWEQEKAVMRKARGAEILAEVKAENPALTTDQAKAQTEYEIEAIAADRVKASQPTFTRMNAIGRAALKPGWQTLFASFVGFRSEMLRIAVANPALAIKDIQSGNPTLVAAGARRLVGTMMGYWGAYAVAAVFKAINKISDEEDEAARELMPPWDKDAQLWMWRNDEGQLVYFNTSFINPLAVNWDPFPAAFQAARQNGALDGIKTLAWKLAEPFVTLQIGSQGVIEAMNNRTFEGRPIANPESDSYTQDLFYHAFESVLPQFKRTALPLSQSVLGLENRQGEVPEFWPSFIYAAFGRAATVEPATSFKYRSYELNGSLRDSARLISRTARSPRSVSDEQIIKDYNEANRAYQKNIERAHKMARGQLLLGTPGREIREMLKKAGMSKSKIQQIILGYAEPYQISDTLAREIPAERVRLLRKQEKLQPRRTYFSQP